MKKLKRILALFLAMLFTTGIMSSTLFAVESGNYVQNYTYTKEYNKNAEKGVIPSENCSSCIASDQIVTPGSSHKEALPDVTSARPPVLMTPNESDPNNDTVRYNVLVLDTSSSSDFRVGGEIIYTADTAIEYMKVSAKKFIEGIENAEGTNYIAIIEYKGEIANTVSSFSTDYDALNNAIDNLSESEHIRNVASGLQTAAALLDGISDPNAIKNVVLFTTGMTNAGDYSYEGHYNENTPGSGWYRMDTGIHLYAYANVAYQIAEALKGKATVYSIGLFQTMENMPEEGLEIVQFFKLFAKDLATPGHFYDVKDPQDLEFIFGGVADIIIGNEFKFTYRPSRPTSKPNTEGDEDCESICYYSDLYFFESSCGDDPNDGARAKAYNTSLSTASLCLAMSAFSSNDGGKSSYNTKDKNVKDFLTKHDLGFSDFESHGYNVKPESDSIAAAFASKPLNVNGEDYTLIAAAVRGGNYESEWAGNFTLGITGQHQGFAHAKEQVLEWLKGYIRDKNITGKIKLWLVGYSRGAATANLVAGAIDDGEILGGSITLAKEDMYAYCFETPQGALKDQTEGKEFTYNNIYNIVNRNDFVPRLAMSGLGFTRCGEDIFLPCAINDSNYETYKDKMLKFYKNDDCEWIPGTDDYIVDDFKMKKVVLKSIIPGVQPFIPFIQDDEGNNWIQAQFLDKVIPVVTKCIIETRENYVHNLQDIIRTCIISGVAGLFPDVSPWQALQCWNLFLHKLFGWKTLGRLIQAALLNPQSTDNIEAVIRDTMMEVMVETGIEYDSAVFANVVYAIAKLLITARVLPDYTATLATNIDLLRSAHFPELCLAWLMTMDYNYTSNPIVWNGSGNYRVIHINCPVDVNVYDSAENLVASIIDDEPQMIEGSAISAGLNGDGEKTVSLPANESYRIELIATGGGLMDYSVNEFSSSIDDITRVICYQDVVLTEGDMLTAMVPAYADNEQYNGINGSTTHYALCDSDGNELDTDKDLIGEEAQAAYYMVSVTVEPDGAGITLGQGIRQDGNFAKVEAAAQEGYEFAGWYEGSELLSVDAEYRFRVERDIELTAKFDKTDEPVPPTPPTPPGTGFVSLAAIGVSAVIAGAGAVLFGKRKMK